MGGGLDGERISGLFDLSGRVALVTGASRGLGLQMATALGAQGARLALVARHQAGLDAAADLLARRGCEVFGVASDLGRAEGIPALVDRVLAHYGRIDVLVNNAGTSWAAPAEAYPDAAWRKVMQLNLDAPFFLCREVARRAMIPGRAGKIVNIASVSALLGNAHGIEAVAYNASKGGVVSLTRALAAEWGRYNINVNAICPGFFPSKMSRGVLERIGPEVVAATPLARLGGEEDLMGSVVFLASEASRHMTGQCLVVDGGASIV